MKRREFIKNAGIAASVPFLINGMRLSAKASPIFDELALNSQAEDRILVLIQLVGGNDGLNTVIPVDQYSVLSQLRESVFVPESSLLDFHGNLKLHPALSGFQKLWEDQKLETILNIGYPNQNLSHFRSTDIWTSASDYDQYVGSGWLGRYLAEKHPNYPQDYPNSETTDPLSLSVGPIVSQTCQGPVYSMGMAAANIDNIYNIDQSDSNIELETYAGDELDYIRTVLRQTGEYVGVIETAAEKGNVNDALWQANGENRLADQLKIVARLIKGGLKTKIYVCSMGDFDTHSGQSEQNDPLSGRHTELLSTLGNAVNSFQNQLAEYQMEDKVLGMTFSEFGRRIMSNNSYGTDHGAAACHFLFGTSVNPVVHGQYEELNTDVQQNDNLTPEYDFRAIYYNVLKDWFQVEKQVIDRVMFREYDEMQILRPEFKSVEQQIFDSSVFKVFPNPASRETTLKFYTLTSKVKIELIDSQGQVLQTILNKQMAEGDYRISLRNLDNYPTGVYYLRLRSKYGAKTLNMTIVR